MLLKIPGVRSTSPLGFTSLSNNRMYLMRNLFVLLMSCAAAFGLLVSTGQAQKTEPKTPEDPEKILQRLLKNVKQKDDASLRLQAIVGLADFGAKAEPAIPHLLDAMQTKNE